LHRFAVGSKNYRMEWSEAGIVIGTRRHGETSVIVEAVTAGHGRHLGLVRGGRSRRLRPLLQPGNTLVLTWRARLDEHLGNFRAEPLVERGAALMGSPAAVFGLALAASHLRLLPERDPHPRLYAALSAMLDDLDRPDAAAELMARFELLLLDELGFGLDLESCAATGRRDDLAYVSPKSGRAVGREAGAPYAQRLLPLPRFLLAENVGGAPSFETEDAFRLTGYFLERHVYEPRGQGMPDARASFLKALGGISRAVA
jgi:DNA repair protein RecO (recombination protein O)